LASPDREDALQLGPGDAAEDGDLPRRGVLELVDQHLVEEPVRAVLRGEREGLERGGLQVVEVQAAAGRLRPAEALRGVLGEPREVVGPGVLQGQHLGRQRLGERPGDIADRVHRGREARQPLGVPGHKLGEALFGGPKRAQALGGQQRRALPSRPAQGDVQRGLEGLGAGHREGVAVLRGLLDGVTDGRRSRDGVDEGDRALGGLRRVLAERSRAEPPEIGGVQLTAEALDGAPDGGGLAAAGQQALDQRGVRLGGGVEGVVERGLPEHPALQLVEDCEIGGGRRR
jgi:hypothetical protein